MTKRKRKLIQRGSESSGQARRLQGGPKINVGGGPHEVNPRDEARAAAWTKSPAMTVVRMDMDGLSDKRTQPCTAAQ
jgi:hypothetical protein